MDVFDLPKQDKEHLYKFLTLVCGLAAVLPKLEKLNVEKVCLRLVTHKNTISLSHLLENKISYDAVIAHYELDQFRFSLHYLDFREETIKTENGVGKEWVILLYPRFERGK